MSVTPLKNGKILAVVGPTASGKTALAVELAKRLDGEIISCDSMQVYKRMDIGTAKVTKAEMQGIPHHLIDVSEPTSDFSCADYSEMAKKAIEDIRSRGKTPIFCGGTGLYLDSVIGISGFSDAGKDELFREEMSKKTPAELHALLSEIDPAAAKATHMNNVKRVIRALEIFHVTGKTKTEWDEESKKLTPPYECTVIGLDFKSREALYERIDKRVDVMLEIGLAGEIEALDCPDFRASTASDGIGYKEYLAYLDGEVSFSEAVDKIKQASRNYAKRQLTWFRRNKIVNWIYVDDFEGEDKFKFIVNSAINIINNN